MKYRQVGNSGLRISEIGIGSWLTIGGQLDVKESSNVIYPALENGVTFIDTADAYNNGDAEETIGTILAEEQFRRNHLVLSSKVYFPMSEDINDRGLSRKHIRESILGTLERLQTDYLDIYFAHRFDYGTPLKETIRTMTNLIDEGLVNYWGTSCWRSYQLERVQWLAKEMGCVPPIVEQPMYNMFYRYPELYEFRVCRYHGIGLTVFSPLAEGFLTGKYLEEVPEESRAKTADRSKITRSAEDRQKLEQLQDMALERNISLPQLALAWILAREDISAVIIGATKEKHIKENIEASNIRLSDSELGQIEKILDTKPQVEYKYLPQKIR